MNEHKTLIAAQLAVMEDVPYLQKTSSKGLNYTFASEADLIHKVRVAMLEHGLTLAPVGAEIVYSGDKTTNQGKAMPHLRLKLRYRVSHAPSGEYLELETIGEAQDTSDKSSNKAMTIGLKYAIRQFFLIETGDDPDVVAHNRDSDNAGWVTTAVNKINACKTEEKLEEQLERFRGKHPDTGEALFTEDQLDELDVYAARHRRKLKS